MIFLDGPSRSKEFEEVLLVETTVATKGANANRAKTLPDPQFIGGGGKRIHCVARTRD